MAKILDKDPAIYERERDTFLKDLLHFHESRGTPIKRTPKINGADVDLYLLYVLITGRGGWYKVNVKNEWDLVLDSFGNVPKHCVNSGVALKQIYLRYLDRYEKAHFLGDVVEGRTAEEEEEAAGGGSRHHRPRWSAKALHSVPLVYNHAQHNVTGSGWLGGSSLEVALPIALREIQTKWGNLRRIKGKFSVFGALSLDGLRCSGSMLRLLTLPPPLSTLHPPSPLLTLLTPPIGVQAINHPP
ncbi:hypothetical protein LSTR_LSTR011162 [Laodelphax striatellus]|uniref:ARID domain-containing protein n=1 Tax=Laodelphax striatellus TaxID=195883 RepID=A0A482XST1_LAOST|nr:hypothetical protein LSTR_LSTR011162 [Laodelphax striatellus]